MTVRNRSRAFTKVNGTWRRFGDTFGGNNVTVLAESVSDWDGEGDNLTFDVSRRSYQGGVIHSQPQGNDYYTTYFDNYICEAVQYQNVFVPVSSFPGELSKTAYATMTAARTNPSRPYVDVPVNVLELTEIVGLLRNAGNTVIKKAANNYLKYNFAIKPIVSDLFKLTQFQAQVDKRVQEIIRLKGERGLRRTIHLARLGRYDLVQDIALQSQGTLIVRDLHRYASREIRGHARWLPAAAVEHLSQREMSALARRAVLGLTVDFATAWERIPWSWLVDWSGTLGAYLMAQRNIIPAVLSQVSIMTTTRTRYSRGKFTAGSSPTHHVSPLDVLLETKKRELVAVAPTAHLPFLSARQLGILASLYIVKR